MSSQRSGIIASKEDDLSRRWRRASKRYVSAINAFVERIREVGRDGVGEEPKDTSKSMAKAVLNAVRRANRLGKIEGLHERFPPAHEPFVEMLEENGQTLPMVLMLDDGRILVKIGPHFETGNVIIIDDLNIAALPSDVITVGRSPKRKYFAIARKKGITIHRGWDGPTTATLKWPTGKEGVPNGFNYKPIGKTLGAERVVPFDTGDRALLVNWDGVFVLSTDKAARLLPTKREMRERFKRQKKENPKRRVFFNVSMAHCALSPNGKLIAAGHQSSLHYVFDADTFEIVGEIGHCSEYPHYAVFSSDGRLIAFNSCHFYGGETIGVPTKLLPGLKTESYEPDSRITKFEGDARVYAAVFRNDEFIVGDARGYVFAFDIRGKARWQHFIGSTVCDIDVSSDGKRLVVTTYAGFLCILDLDTGKVDPFAIGTSTHQERRRWLFWQNEPGSLVW